MSTPTHPLDPAKLFHTVAEAASRLNMSRKSVYRLLERGLLKSSSALRKKLIPAASIEEFIAEAMKGQKR
jgi:excisionase family DNA binding protein